MKNKSIKKHSIRRKLFFCFTMFFIGIIISFKYLEKNSNININSKLNDYLLEKSYESFSNKIFLDKYKSLIKEDNKSEEITSPIIYIYNSHDTEEYQANNLFQISPNVTMINYILKEKFESNNLPTLVEERSIKEILNKNNWNYASSYKASRIYLNEVKEKYPSIKYFIDVHRDSLTKEKTTTIINDKSYAKILFLIGLENPSYEANLSFVNSIDEKLKVTYPSLSKGVLKKGGEGVNGLYNQDISPNSILVEFGGYQNTSYEVINSSLAFADTFMEVINAK